MERQKVWIFSGSVDPLHVCILQVNELLQVGNESADTHNCRVREFASSAQKFPLLRRQILSAICNFHCADSMYSVRIHCTETLFCTQLWGGISSCTDSLCYLQAWDVISYCKMQGASLEFRLWESFRGAPVSVGTLILAEVDKSPPSGFIVAHWGIPRSHLPHDFHEVHSAWQHHKAVVETQRGTCCSVRLSVHTDCTSRQKIPNCMFTRTTYILTSSQLVAIHVSPGVAHALSQCVNATGYSIVCLRMWCYPASLQPTPWCRLHKSKAQCDDALYSPTTPLYDDVCHFKIYGCMDPPQGLAHVVACCQWSCSTHCNASTASTTVRVSPAEGSGDGHTIRPSAFTKSQKSDSTLRQQLKRHISGCKPIRTLL